MASFSSAGVQSGTTGLKGVAELTAKLKALGGLEDGLALRRAVRAGMKPALDAARKTIPIGTVPHKSYKGNVLPPGYASKHLFIITTVAQNKSFATAFLGPNKEAFYATAFVEVGTSKMKAEPWLRPAFYASANEQRTAMSASLEKSITKIATTTPSGVSGP